MTVPNDVSRCEGRISNRPLGQIGGVRVTSNMGHVECLRCLRREASPADTATPHIAPPTFFAGKCPMRIAA